MTVTNAGKQAMVDQFNKKIAAGVDPRFSRAVLINGQIVLCCGIHQDQA